MCSIQDQFNGFLASNQLKVGERVGVKDFNWSPQFYENNTNFSDEKITDTMLIGKKAERFFSIYLKRFDSRKIQAENIQIIESGITLGELDAIIQEKERIVHLELVYKFYLFDPSLEGEEIQKWIGPNRKDHLHSKLEKLEQKQFPLLWDPVTKKNLEKQGFRVEKMEQELLFLANCFVPWRFSEKTQLTVDGYWLTSEQIRSEEFSNQQFFIPPKQQWMIRECTGVLWLSRTVFLKELETHLAINRSPLVWIKNKEHSFSRIFVVWW